MCDRSNSMSKRPEAEAVKPSDDTFSGKGDSIPGTGRGVEADAVSSQASVHAAFPDLTVTDQGISENPVTIGEALEATAVVLGEKPVDHADAAAIVAAEMRATGLAGVIPGGVGAAALAAAENNSTNEKESEKEKTTISDVLLNASAVLPANKVVTREDAVSIKAAEEQISRWARDGKETGFGVASTVMEAAETNEDNLLDRKQNV